MLFQEGTDVENYESLESLTDTPVPIFPFLLWTTNDRDTGKLYLKIDRKSFLVGTLAANCDKGAIVLQAFSLAMKAHYVFNLTYHPYLRAVFNYFECLSGLNEAPLGSVSKLNAALRALSQ